MIAHGLPSYVALPLALVSAFSSFGCSPAPPPSSAARSERTAPRQVCEAMIKATRGCRDPYLTALLRTRVRFDEPPGIAARYAEMGEAALLKIAQEEFAADWSDRGMTQRCDAFMAMTEEQRDDVLARERPCLTAKGDCGKFVACNMKALEAKWAQAAQARPEPTQ